MTINMPISRIDSSNNANGSGAFNVQNKPENTSFKGKVWEIKSEKLAKNIGWLGDDFNSAQQRAVSGVTGILLQPWFDLNNKRVDEDTRIVSTARTLGKIIAGMTTGVLIRWGLIEAAKHFCKTTTTEQERINKLIEKEKAKGTGKVITEKARTVFKPYEQWLLPKEYVNKSFREVKKYRLAFGTVAAVGVMFFTNFLIDAPLTTYLTNKFTKMMTGKDPSQLAKAKEKGGN